MLQQLLLSFVALSLLFSPWRAPVAKSYSADRVWPRRAVVALPQEARRYRSSGVVPRVGRFRGWRARGVCGDDGGLEFYWGNECGGRRRRCGRRRERGRVVRLRFSDRIGTTHTGGISPPVNSGYSQQI